MMNKSMVYYFAHHSLYSLKVIIFQLFANINDSLNSVLDYCATSGKSRFLQIFTSLGSEFPEESSNTILYEV